MIQELKDTPNTMVGFRAIGEITKEDFDKVVLPAVAELVKRIDKLNYLLILDTPIKEFTFGAWMSDAMLGLNNMTKWNRVAIISDSSAIQSFTDIFSKIMPGEFRGYEPSQLKEAINWVGEQNGIVEKQVLQEEGTAEE